MSEVSCRVCAALLEAVAQDGLPEGELVRGLSVSVEELRVPSNRIRWDDFTALLENGARLLGGADALEELAARYYGRGAGILAALAAGIGSARPLYHMGARWYGPSIYTNTRGSCVDLPDGRIRQTIQILPGYRDCPLFFRVMRGGLRSVPLMLGQPSAKVEMQLSPRLGTYTIEPPPPLAPWERLRSMLSRRRVLARAEEELTLQYEELRQGYEKARNAETRLEEEVHERERAEQLLQQAQKLDAMGRLAGGIAHDFNNVLIAISGYAELALERLHPEDPVARDIEEIRAVSQRGAGLVKQILAFSRPQMTAPRRLDLNTLLLRMEKLLRRLLPESVQLSIRTWTGPLPVLADAGQLEQIVVNLVVNARDAIEGAGRIEIELEALSDGAPPAVRLTVRDDGCGMDPRTLSRAFEPFFSTKPPGRGTGLGLATVESIVTRNGGSIRIESEPGRGTTARVELPRSEASEADESLAEPHADGGSETVLLVEDEDSVRAVLRRLLQARGYEVVAAADAAEADALARSHPGPIELLVTDVVLPDTDGRDLAGRIDAARRELRGVVFISGHAPDDAWSGAPPPRNHVLLHKPFEPETLLAAARRVLDA